MSKEFKRNPLVSFSVVAFATASKPAARMASLEQFAYDLSLVIGAGDRSRVDATLAEIKAKAISKDGEMRKTFAGALFPELVRAVEQAVNQQQIREHGQRQTTAEKTAARESGWTLAMTAHDAADAVIQARKDAAAANIKVDAVTGADAPEGDTAKVDADATPTGEVLPRGVIVDADSVDNNIDALLSAIIADIGLDRAELLAKVMAKACKAIRKADADAAKVDVSQPAELMAA